MSKLLYLILILVCIAPLKCNVIKEDDLSGRWFIIASGQNDRFKGNCETNLDLTREEPCPKGTPLYTFAAEKDPQRKAPFVSFDTDEELREALNSTVYFNDCSDLMTTDTHDTVYRTLFLVKQLEPSYKFIIMVFNEFTAIGIIGRSEPTVSKVQELIAKAKPFEWTIRDKASWKIDCQKE